MLVIALLASLAAASATFIYLRPKPPKQRKDVKKQVELLCDDGVYRWVWVHIEEGKELHHYSFLIGHTVEGNVLGKVLPTLVPPYNPLGNFEKISGESKYPPLSVEDKLCP